MKLSFDKIFKELNPTLCSYASGIVKDIPNAQDIVSEVFVKYWQKEHEYENIQAAKASLLISTRNACFNHKRSLKRKSLKLKRIHSLFGPASVETVTKKDSELLIEDLFKLIELLPPRTKQAVTLIYSEGLDFKAAAKIMGCSSHTVRNLNNRGVEILRESYLKILKKEFN